MKFLLKHGSIISNDKLHINDDVKTTNYMLKFLYIVTGFSFAASGFNTYFNVSKPLILFFILLFIYDIIILIGIYKRSDSIEIDYIDIKRVSLKNYWKIKNTVVLKLQNGKNRIIGGFKNIEDTKTFIQFIESKIISKS